MPRSSVCRGNIQKSIKNHLSWKKQKQKTKNIHNGYSDHAVISLHLCRRPKGVHIFYSIVNKGESQYLYQLQNFEIAIKVTNNSPGPVARPKIRRLTRTKVHYLHYGKTKKKKKKRKERKKKMPVSFITVYSRSTYLYKIGRIK